MENKQIFKIIRRLVQKLLYLPNRSPRKKNKCNRTITKGENQENSLELSSLS